MGRAAQTRKAVRKGRTQRYYDANPEKNRLRLIQQTEYNKHGSSKPGTKNITGRAITKAANRLRAALKLPVGDPRDAGHGPGNKEEAFKKGGPQNKKRNRQRLRYRGGR